MFGMLAPSVTGGVRSMHDNENSITSSNRVLWNKGKLIGPRPPLRQKHVWAIRTRLQIEQQVRDLALFNLAIDSKLRGCDVVAVRVDDVAPTGTPSSERPYGRERPADQYGLSSRSKPDRRLTSI